MGVKLETQKCLVVRSVVLPRAQRICCEKKERGVFGQIPVARQRGTYFTFQPLSIAPKLPKLVPKFRVLMFKRWGTHPVWTSSENPISAVPPTSASDARLYTALLPTQIDAPHRFLLTCTTR